MSQISRFGASRSLLSESVKCLFKFHLMHSYRQRLRATLSPSIVKKIDVAPLKTPRKLLQLSDRPIYRASNCFVSAVGINLQPDPALINHKSDLRNCACIKWRCWCSAFLTIYKNYNRPLFLLSMLVHRVVSKGKNQLRWVNLVRIYS